MHFSSKLGGIIHILNRNGKLQAKKKTTFIWQKVEIYFVQNGSI